jgi:hypothetical protein
MIRVPSHHKHREDLDDSNCDGNAYCCDVLPREVLVVRGIRVRWQRSRHGVGGLRRRGRLEDGRDVAVFFRG